MADYEDGIFSNLPRPRRRPGERDDDDRRLSPRQLLAMNFVPEGPLPQRPRPSSRKGGSSPSGPHAPVISAAPMVTGNAAVGQTLSCSTGTWLYVPTGYTYQWLRDGTPIAGATSSTYVVVSGDLTHAISCTVTATNATGNASATSNAVTIVSLPANTAAPVASGSLTVGSTLSCTTGTWTNSPTSYAYQWQRGGVNIAGATSSTYTTVTADGGTSVTCVVTASNAGGGASATSNALAISGGVVTSVWSAADAAANAMTLTNGGLTVVAGPNNAGWQSIRTTISRTSGKLYVEFLAKAGTSAQYLGIGLANSTFIPTDNLGASNYSAEYGFDTTNTVSAGFTSNYSVGNSAATNDVFAMAVDFTAGSVWIAQNNVWINGSNPATGLLPVLNFVPATVGALFAAMSLTDPVTSGTWTLQPTAASQKYAPPAGFTPWDGAGAHSAQATAYLARTVGGNEGGNGANIATLIDGLVADGVWAKLDALYVLAQQNQTDARLNLIGTNYSLTGTLLAQAAPRILTFTPYQGFSNFTSSATGLDTGFNPTTAISPNYTLNNASFGIWPYAVISEAVGQIATTSAGPHSYIYNFNGGLFYPRINDSGAYTQPTTITKGLFAAERISSTTVFGYQNGVGGSSSVSSDLMDNGDFTIGRNSTTGISAQTLSAAFIGASLGAAGQLALYNRLRTYMTAVGVP